MSRTRQIGQHVAWVHLEEYAAPELLQHRRRVVPRYTVRDVTCEVLGDFWRRP